MKARLTPVAPMQPVPGRPDLEVPVIGCCSGTALRKAARRISLLYDVEIAATGLRSTQMSGLIHIARLGEPTMSELASSLIIDRSALSEAIKPLIREGFVEARVCENDRRNRRVNLTEAGYVKLAEIVPLWKRAQARFELAFGVAEAAHLRVSLARIASDEFLETYEGTGFDDRRVKASA